MYLNIETSFDSYISNENQIGQIVSDIHKEMKNIMIRTCYFLCSKENLVSNRIIFLKVMWFQRKILVAVCIGN